MMNRLRLVAALCVAMVAHAVAAQQPPASTAVDPDLQRAKGAMADLGQLLRIALQKKIAEDGIVAAVGFCHDEAPRIAAAVSENHGVNVGRTSLKHRSSGNAPTAWQRAVLDDFATRVGKGEAVVDLSAALREGSTLRVAKGLPVEAPCLMCHGRTDTISPEVAQAIVKRYPGDQATGFVEGDLRGLVWAEVALDVDARTPIAMNADQQRALRAEMRRHLDNVHQVIAALAAGDWAAVAEAASGFAPTHGQGAGQGRAERSNFRSTLPEQWFAFARPMHAAMRKVGEEARAQKRRDVALAGLADATVQCTGCHATFRIDSAAAVVANARRTRPLESAP